MIYNYEKSISDIGEALGMKSVAYADNEEIFRSLVKVVKYPVMWFERDDSDWLLSKKIPTVTPKNTENNLIPFKQNYTAHFLVETQGEALKLASDIRHYFFKHPYVETSYSEGDIRVGMFVTGVSVDSQRGSYDTKGSQREVTLKWWSQLFFEETQGDSAYGLVENFRIYINEDQAFDYLEYKGNRSE